MEEAINKLDEAGLLYMWDATFSEYPLDDLIQTLSDDVTDEDILYEMRNMIIDRIRFRERRRPRVQLTEAINEQCSRRQRKAEELSKARREHYNRRQQRRKLNLSYRDTFMNNY